MKYFKTVRYFCCLLLIHGAGSLTAQSFNHPGLLQGMEDIERIRKGIAEKQEPLYSGFLVFQSHPQSQYTYQMRGPMSMIGRNPTIGQESYDSDANAAYQNALMWALTDNKAYAHKAIEIVNKWSVTLKSITGKDAVLMAGLGPFKMVNAAEILRYTNSGWSAADILQTEKHFKEVIYPVIKNFAPFANGNWDSATLKTTMAIGIFCNDRQVFEQALRYYEDGAGDGSLEHYIINDDGECQESGRDQAHTQLGIAHLGDCAELAWHQGLNLYAYHNNLLLKGFEYTAKYNLGMDVPYTSEIDRTGKYLHPVISEISRGKLRAVYEQIYNHYVNRMGMKAPYTRQAAEKIRPELQGLPGADHIGFGTLLYTRAYGEMIRTATPPATPGGLIAKPLEGAGIHLTWIGSVGADYYTIKRSKKIAGRFVTLKKAIAVAGYTDTEVVQGKPYFYTVTASNKNGRSINSLPVAITAGLPGNWKQADIGASTGTAAFDGQGFTIKGEGRGIDSLNEQFHLVYRHFTGDGSITVRYVPQISSQFSCFGLVMCDAADAGAGRVSLILHAQSAKQIEAPEWYVGLLSDATGNKVSKFAGLSPQLAEPIVTNGRLTGYCWLRLRRKGTEITGYYSADGQKWNEIATITSKLKPNGLVGLSVASGLPTISTTVKFDYADINGVAVK